MADRVPLERADISEMEMQQLTITWGRGMVKTGELDENGAPVKELQTTVTVSGTAKNPRNGRLYEHSCPFSSLGIAADRTGATNLKDDFLVKLMDRYFAP